MCLRRVNNLMLSKHLASTVAARRNEKMDKQRYVAYLVFDGVNYAESDESDDEVRFSDFGGVMIPFY